MSGSKHFDNKRYRKCFLLLFKSWLTYSFCSPNCDEYMVSFFFLLAFSIVFPSAHQYTETWKHACMTPVNYQCKSIERIMVWWHSISVSVLTAECRGWSEKPCFTRDTSCRNNFAWPCASLNNTVKLIQLAAIKEPSHYLHSTSN